MRISCAGWRWRGTGWLHRSFRPVAPRRREEREREASRQLQGPSGGGPRPCGGRPAAEGQTTLPQRCARPGRSAAVGVPAADPVLSHALLVTGSVTWCRTCGAYADARVRSFRGRCTGPPLGRGGSGRTSIRRLLAGCHPLSGEHMGAMTMSLRAMTWPVAAPGGSGMAV